MLSWRPSLFSTFQITPESAPESSGDRQIKSKLIKRAKAQVNQPESIVAEFPPEVLCEIFKYLPLNFLLLCCAVSRTWGIFASKAFLSRPTRFRLFETSSKTKYINICTKLPSLSRLKVLELNPLDKVTSFSFIAKLSRLESLSVHGQPDVRKLFPPLNAVANITSLGFYGVSFAGSEILPLCLLRLTSLTISNPAKFDHTRFYAVRCMTELKSLRIYDTKMNWPLWCLSSLGELTGLRDLEIQVTWRQQFLWLSRLTCLQSLTFSSYEQFVNGQSVLRSFADAWIDTRPLKHLEYLTSLSMTGEIWDINDIRNLTRLRKLTVQAATITTLEPIRNAKDIRKLDLRGCYFPNYLSLNSELAACLINYWGLSELCLASVSFPENEPLAFLAAVSPSIAVLNLSRTSLKDSDVILHFPRFWKLRKLYMSHCKWVTQKSRGALSQLNELETLSLDLRRWWKRYHQELLEACPKLKQIASPKVSPFMEFFCLGKY